jgi:lactoylglutathione lyase
MNTTLEWVILITKRYSAMKTFYGKTLGLPVVRNVPEEEFTQFQMKNCFLAIYGVRFVEGLIGKKYIGKPTQAIYSFGESKDIDRDYQQLGEKGVQFIHIPKTQSWGQRTAYFCDPDGNVWELQQWIKK